MFMSQIIGLPIFEVNRNSDSISKENIGMSIGARVREARTDAKLTQGELAQKIGLKQSTISELETGKSASSSLLASIAAVLGVSALWLEKNQGPKHMIKGASPKELMLIAAYRDATEEGKAFIEMACSQAPKSSTSRAK